MGKEKLKEAEEVEETSVGEEEGAAEVESNEDVEVELTKPGGAKVLAILKQAKVSNGSDSVGMLTFEVSSAEIPRMIAIASMGKVLLELNIKLSEETR